MSSPRAAIALSGIMGNNSFKYLLKNCDQARHIDYEKHYLIFFCDRNNAYIFSILLSDRT